MHLLVFIATHNFGFHLYIYRHCIGDTSAFALNEHRSCTDQMDECISLRDMYTRNKENIIECYSYGVGVDADSSDRDWGILVT